MAAMKIEVSEDELKLITEALEHLYAYMRAAKRDDARYQELADRLKVSVAVDAAPPKIGTKKKR